MDFLNPPLPNPLSYSTRVYSSNFLAYASMYFSTPTWIISLAFLRAGHSLRYQDSFRDAVQIKSLVCRSVYAHLGFV